MNVYGFRYNERVAMKTLPVVRQRGVCCGLPDVDEKWAEDTSTLMKALADPTRLTMVASLWKAKTPICICDFTAGPALSQPPPPHHNSQPNAAGLGDPGKRRSLTHHLPPPPPRARPR